MSKIEATTDVTHLRALLAEQTARADHEHAEMQKQAKLAVDWMIDAQRALAANAEMRAALERIAEIDDYEADGYAEAIERAQAALSRPDLGAGVVVVPREVVERVRGAIVDGWAGINAPKVAEIIADLDALLEKAGG